MLFRKVYLRLLEGVASLEGAKVTKGCKRKVVHKALIWRWLGHVLFKWITSGMLINFCRLFGNSQVSKTWEWGSEQIHLCIHTYIHFCELGAILVIKILLCVQIWNNYTIISEWDPLFPAVKEKTVTYICTLNFLCSFFQGTVEGKCSALYARMKAPSRPMKWLSVTNVDKVDCNYPTCKSESLHTKI